MTGKVIPCGHLINGIHAANSEEFLDDIAKEGEVECPLAKQGLENAD